MKSRLKKINQPEPVNQKEITLWIDSYNDIFSDFDPRPFSERAISDDFITQVKRVSRESNGKISVLKLLIPEGTQKDESEKVIRRRLQSYFQNTSFQLKDEQMGLIKKGIMFSFFGIAFMIAATYISFLQLSEFAFKLLLALFEPGGWFLLWTGLDLLIVNSWSKKNEKSFYTRFENSHIEFGSYK